jgi:hypothetical protein
MLCIEVSRNGTRLATAGLPGKGVISLLFDRILSDNRGPDELRSVRLGALDCSGEQNENLNWLYEDVAICDEFVVRFIEGEVADEPERRSPSVRRSAEEARTAETARLEWLEAEAKKLREKLGLPPRP